MPTKNKKPIYEVNLQVVVEVSVSISAESIQEAISTALQLKLDELVKPADSACEIVDFDIPGVKWVQAEGNIAFKK